MIRILFFNQSREIGGTDTFLINLIRAWSGKDDHLVVWCNQGHKGVSIYQGLGIDFDRITFPTIGELYRLIEKYKLPLVVRKAYKVGVFLLKGLIFVFSIVMFYKRLRVGNFDVVFSSNGGYPAGELCQALVIAGKLARVKKVFLIIHNDALTPRFPFRLWEILIDKIISNACTEIISVSNSCARQIEITRYFNRRIKVIYNGILPERKDYLSLEEKRKILGIDSTWKVIGDIGDYEERKGHEYLIKAFVEVKKAFSKVKLLIIGSAAFPYAKVLERLIKELNLEEDVRLTGYLANAWEYIECFDVLVLPSVSFESFGMVLLEAMLYKKAVIGTSVGGIPEVIGDAGNIVPSRDSSQLAERIIHLLSHPELAREFEEKGFNRLHANFTSSRMAREYYDLAKGR